jgi:hypothetical protein
MVHSLAPAAVWKRPGSHSVHSFEEAGAYFPSAHAEQEAVATAALNLPAGHGVQLVTELESSAVNTFAAENWPGGQKLHWSFGEAEVSQYAFAPQPSSQ